MPEMDGFEAAQRIKALYAAQGLPSPPVIALTANAFAEDRKRCLDEGLDDYLAKPFERSDLEAVLEKWATTRIPHRNGRLGGHAA
jgi:CheY-like chemotaxis protein